MRYFKIFYVELKRTLHCANTFTILVINSRNDLAVCSFVFNFALWIFLVIYSDIMNIWDPVLTFCFVILFLSLELYCCFFSTSELL